MRVPVSWLREYVAVEATTSELAARLGISSLEVERIEQYHRDYNVVERDAPLYGTRSLFRTND